MAILMDSDNIDEKLIRWNEIFEQMVIDVQTLVKDFSGMINWPIPVAILIFVIGGATFIAAVLLSTELLILVYTFFLMCCMIVSGLLILRHWYHMKQRYDRLFAMQRAMETS